MRVAAILLIALTLACAESERRAIPTATPDYQGFFGTLPTATPEPTRTPISTIERFPKVYARELFYACGNLSCEHRGERVMIQGEVGQNHYGRVVQYVMFPVTSNGRGVVLRGMTKEEHEAVKQGDLIAATCIVGGGAMLGLVLNECQLVDVDASGRDPSGK